ncbi:hypothetical protein LNQ03_00050 [Klebsiella pneumoniae subsp. pneumoniae]|nr:hypothetical protein [Klebsiella pneumoniae subsp. pneumoniae]
MIDRQLATPRGSRGARFTTQNFSTFPLLLTTLPLFATVPQGWRTLAGAVCAARDASAGSCIRNLRCAFCGTNGGRRIRR